MFLRSIWLGALATLISLLLGYPLAYIISKMSVKRQSMMIMLVMLPMWMNFASYLRLDGPAGDNGPVNAALSLFGLGPYTI